MNRLEIKKSLCVTVATISLLTLPYSMEVFASEHAQYTGRDKAAYDLAYSTGVQAVVYGWTPVMMDVALKLQTSVSQPMSNGQAPINEFGPITRLWDYRDRSYTTPNNDTIYLQLWGDLEEQPYVLTVPPIRDRYWIAQIIDMYTESVVDLGNATVGEVGGDFVLAKRGYEGELPEGLPVFYSDTRYIWIAGRLGASSSQDEKQALELQSMFRFTPLSKYPETLAQPVPKLATNAPTVQFPQGLAWFEKLNDVLEANPLPEDAALIDTFKYIGIGSEGVKSLNDVQKEALKKAFKDGFAIIRDAAVNTGEPVNGWNWEFDAGRYGTDYLLRAAVNMNSIGLNSPERAMYPKRYVDDMGELLDGKNSYEITFPADMPVNYDLGGFWSLTMYDALDRFMVENEIDRYKIASNTENLIYNNDGSLTVYISFERPVDPEKLSNWLPAPDDKFMLQVRMYEPKPVVYEGSFDLPELKKVNN